MDNDRVILIRIGPWRHSRGYLAGGGQFASRALRRHVLRTMGSRLATAFCSGVPRGPGSLPTGRAPHRMAVHRPSGAPSLGMDARWPGCAPLWIRPGYWRKGPSLPHDPHVRHGWAAPNTHYVAKEALDGALGPRPACGGFEGDLRLTAAGRPRPSTRAMPPWLNPRQCSARLTYHGPDRLTSAGELRIVCRPQGSIADIGKQAYATLWAQELFERAA